jgi:hypothetical protein
VLTLVGGAGLTEDSSRSALTFMPPVTREMVSFPDRSVTWTNVSLKLIPVSPESNDSRSLA